MELPNNLQKYCWIENCLSLFANIYFKTPKSLILTKTLLLAITFLVFSTNASSQITKGNWLVSGSVSFSRMQSSSEAALQFKQTNFQISPTIGYFLEDKFALGLKPSLIYGSNNIANSNTVFSIGPFARYYFLNPEKIFNLFFEGNYAYGTISGGQKLNTYGFNAGPVLYFNSSVGLEFIFGYSVTKVIGFKGNNSVIQAGIGFQFHLERDR